MYDPKQQSYTKTEFDKLRAENTKFKAIFKKFPDYFAYEREYKKLEAENAKLNKIRLKAYEACSTGSQGAELECINLCDEFDKALKGKTDG